MSEVGNSSALRKKEPGWQDATLGEYIKVKHGYAFKGKYITSEETDDILVTPGNFNIGGGFKNAKFKYFSSDYPEIYILSGGDVVVTMTDLSKESDTLGYAAKIPNIEGKKLLHNQRIGLVEFKNSDADKDFIYWVMRTKEYQWYIIGSASGTSIMHTSPGRIEAYDFKLPQINEQKAIANVLTSLDDKIDLLNRQNETLEKLAQTLFRQWFVEEASDDWEEVEIGNLGRVVTGKTPSTKIKKYWGTKLPFVTPTDFRLFGKFVLETERFLSQEGENKIKNAVLLSGSILVTCIGSDMGKVAIAQKKCVTNQQINSIILSKNFPFKEYIYYFLKSIYPLLRSMAMGGTTMPIIKKSDFEKIVIPMASENLIKRFETIACDLSTKMYRNEVQIEILEKQRKTLLPKLMSGEIRVKF